MLKEFTLSTQKEGMTDITREVKEVIAASGVTEGIAVVYCVHTTAGITINENADQHVVHDVLFGLNKAFPNHKEFLHDEGNSGAHLKCSSVGASSTLIVTGGKPILGVWQSVFFCEFDGPRTRKFWVKVIAG